MLDWLAGGEREADYKNNTQVSGSQSWMGDSAIHGDGDPEKNQTVCEWKLRGGLEGQCWMRCWDAFENFFLKLLSVRAQGKWWFWTLNVFSHSSVSVYVCALTHTFSHTCGGQKA